jgi:hypothetical protein
MNSRFEEEKQIGLSIVFRTATDFKSLLSVQKLVNANMLVFPITWWCTSRGSEPRNPKKEVDNRLQKKQFVHASATTTSQDTLLTIPLFFQVSTM